MVLEISSRKCEILNSCCLCSLVFLKLRKKILPRKGPPLEEDDRPIEFLVAETFAEIRMRLAARPDLALDEAAAKVAIIEKSGLPVPITRRNDSVAESNRN